jgi:hypothetical protein
MHAMNAGLGKSGFVSRDCSIVCKDSIVCDDRTDRQTDKQTELGRGGGEVVRRTRGCSARVVVAPPPSIDILRVFRTRRRKTWWRGPSFASVSFTAAAAAAIACQMSTTGLCRVEQERQDSVFTRRPGVQIEFDRKELIGITQTIIYRENPPSRKNCVTNF